METPTQYLWNGEIRDRSLEDEYRGDTRTSEFKTIRMACLLTAAAYLSGAVANYLTFGLSMSLAIISAIRVAAFLAALSCFMATYRSSSRQTVDRLIFLYFILLVLGDNVELSFTPSEALPELPGLLVIVLVYYMFYPTRLHLMITGGLLAGFTYSTTTGLVHGSGAPLFANSVIAFLLVNVFGVYYVRTMNRTQRMKFIALRGERESNLRLQEEIAERKKIQQKLFEQATTDELTRVYNRRFFMELSEKELSRSKRHQCGLALIMIDLDHFKAVNDNYGHDRGDLVLKATADCICQNLRKEDLTGRLGGEEFAVLLPDTDFARAMNTAERIRRAIETRHLESAGVEIRTTASLGVAAGFPGPEDDLARWLKLADKALYSAKRKGRNQVVGTPWDLRRCNALKFPG